MNIELMNKPCNTVAKVILEPNETLISEAGAMVAMSGHMAIETKKFSNSGNSLLKGLKRLIAGENFFMNHFSAGDQGGEVILGTSMVGDMMSRKIDGRFIVQGGSFVACSQKVDVDVTWQGLKNFLSGESLFWVNLQGEGDVIVNSFGAIYEIDVDGTYIVDTGHIVAYEETLEFTIAKAGGSWMSTIFGGEGFVCRFSGKGKLYCQTHNMPNFGRSLTPMLREV